LKHGPIALIDENMPAIGAKVVGHGRHVAFQMADIAIPRNLLADIHRFIAELRAPGVTSTAYCVLQSRVP
jgi:glucosamine 6-phosphate synthetase-like amidotransferase/phosphosugar isomerase protein